MDGALREAFRDETLVRDNMDQFVILLFCALTDMGKPVADKFLEGGCNFARLWDAAKEYQTYQPPYCVVLDGSEVPRYYNCIMKVLREEDFLTRLCDYFATLSNSEERNDDVWKAANVVTMSVVHFHLFRLQKEPDCDVPYWELINNAATMATEYNGEQKLEFLAIAFLFLDSVIHYKTIDGGDYADQFRQWFVEKAKETLGVWVQVMDERPERATNMFKFLFQQCMLAVCRFLADLTSYQCYHENSLMWYLETEILDRLWLQIRFCPRFMRKLSGYCDKIHWNLGDGGTSEVMLENVRVRICWGLGLGFDVGYIHSLVNSDLCIPSTVLEYLSPRHYLIDMLTLYKADWGYSMWDDISKFLNKRPVPKSENRLYRIRSTRWDGDKLFISLIDSSTFQNLEDKQKQLHQLVLIATEKDENTKRDVVKFLQSVDVGKADSEAFSSSIESSSKEIAVLFPHDDAKIHVNTKFTYVYELDPKTTTRREVLRNADELLKNAGNPKNFLFDIWCGHRPPQFDCLVSSHEGKKIEVGDLIAREQLDEVTRLLYQICGGKRKVLLRNNSIVVKRDPREKDVWLSVSYEKKAVLNIGLTTCQQAAVLSSCLFPLTLIVGPPGTGKTETMVAVAHALSWNLDPESKILVCTHSNAALDQVLLKLSGMSVARLGQNATSEEAQELTKNSPNESDVIGCTLSYLSCKIADIKTNHKIGAVLIEEAAKILETELLSLLILSPATIVMIGDQAQLHPLIRSCDVRYEGRFNQSLFERFQRLKLPTILLNMQGRARKEIADLYRDRYPKPLEDLEGVSDMADPFLGDYPVQWVDVPGTDNPEESPAEADYIIEVLKLADLQNKWSTRNSSDEKKMDGVSIITPYKRQKELLERQIQKAGLEPRDICTVDEFQGLQNDIIIVSMASPRPSEWLSDEHRITVLVSRARKGLLFFGKMEGFKKVSEWKPIMDAIQKASPNGLDGHLHIDGRDFASYEDLKKSRA